MFILDLTAGFTPTAEPRAGVYRDLNKRTLSHHLRRSNIYLNQLVA